MVSKTKIVGSNPTTCVKIIILFISCSLIGLEYHIANVKILVQFQSRERTSDREVIVEIC